MIQQKSSGPLAALKREYRKQMIVMAILPAMLILTNLNHVLSTLTSIFFLSYVAFCFAVVIFAKINYRLVRKMEEMDNTVKSNLEQQIDTLEKRRTQMITGLRYALLYFIVLTEVMPFFQHARMLDHWHTLHPVIRFSAYATLLILQYFMSRRVSQQKFGQHLAYLRELVGQID